MARRKVDADRGYVMKRHAPTNTQVFMYVDTPGAYLNAFGHPISDKMAKEAGFDTDKLSRERMKRERMEKFQNEMEAELDLVAAGKQKVIAERGGFKVVELALGNANVYDEDDDLMNTVPMPVKQAKALLDALTPEEKAEKPNAGAAQKPKGGAKTPAEKTN